MAVKVRSSAAVARRVKPVAPTARTSSADARRTAARTSREVPSAASFRPDAAARSRPSSAATVWGVRCVLKIGVFVRLAQTAARAAAIVAPPKRSAWRASAASRRTLAPRMNVRLQADFRTAAEALPNAHRAETARTASFPTSSSSSVSATAPARHRASNAGTRPSADRRPSAAPVGQRL